MASERREEVRVVRGDGVEKQQRVVERTPSVQNVLVRRLSQLIWLITGIIVLFIGFRFILLLMAANPANAFANFIYSVSDVLVGPFLGLINSIAIEPGGVIEIASLIAIVVYFVVAAIIVQLLRIVLSGTGGTRQVRTVRRERLD